MVKKRWQCDLTLVDIREFRPDRAWERSWDSLIHRSSDGYQDLMEVPLFNEGPNWERMKSCQHVLEKYLYFPSSSP